METTVLGKRKKCEHGKEKYDCKKCGGGGICDHGKRKRYCKDCGGSGICAHGKRKNRCIECKGPGVCEHNRVRLQCVDCRGTSICKHKRRKACCKDCGGSSICEHNKQKHDCRKCGGSSICKHNTQRRTCKLCGGSSICQHNKQRRVCKECKGSSICEHNRIRNTCIECVGSSICKHNRRRNHCKICNGSSVCPHLRIRYICKECQGGSICEHDKQKSHCIECTPKCACQICFSVGVEKRSRFHPLCFSCYCRTYPDVNIPRQYKIKEHHLRDELKKKYPDVKLVFDKRIDRGCSLRRPDVRIERFTHTIIIECDENRHQGVSCENKRMMELFQDLGNRPLVMLRFNPDRTSSGTEGCFKRTKRNALSLNRKEWNRRIKTLSDRIDHFLTQIPTKEITLEHLFYE